MSQRHELKALTGARGVAAWLVVLFHLRFMMTGIGGARGPMQWGYLAVDFFFVLSGFVIWMTYADRIRDGGLAAIPDFLKRRVARVWPLHIFMLGVALVFALAIATLGHADWDQYPLSQLPLHILLLQNWGFTDKLTWNVPAWSISCELAAYLLFPLLALAVDWRKLPSWMLLLAAAGFAAFVYAVFVVNQIILSGERLETLGDCLRAIFAPYPSPVLGQSILTIGVFRCLGEFALGTVVCALWIRWRDKPVIPALAATALGVTLLAAHVTGLIPQIAALPLVFASLVLVLALTSGLRGNPFELAPIHYLGEISYATYLGHWMLWMGFKLAFIHDHDMGWPLFCLFVVLTLAASVLLYHFVERPAQRWINRFQLPSGTKAQAAH